MGPARRPPGADKPQPTGQHRAWASPAFYHAANQRTIANRANVFIFCRSTKSACYLFAAKRVEMANKPPPEARAAAISEIAGQNRGREPVP